MAMRGSPASAKKTATKKTAAAPAKKVVKRPAKEDAAPAKKGAFGRPAGGAAKKKTAARPKRKQITYKAPADVKSFFLEVQFQMGRDGLLDPEGISIEAIKGSLTNEKAPRYDLLTLAPDTAIALMTRMQYRLFATNPDKRLPANSQFTAVVRLSVTKDGLMRSGIKTLYMVNAKGKEEELGSDLKDKLDVRCIARRKIRSCGRFLAGAFTQMPSMQELKELQADFEAASGAEDDDEE